MMITLDEIEYDHQKNSRNFEKHGIYLTEVIHFEWESSIDKPDNRKNYFENRRIAIGYIKHRLYVLIYVKRLTKIRIISLRKANKREEKKYATS